MPKMNGLDVLKEVKENQEHSKTPVIMLTSEKGEEEKKTALNFGQQFF